MRTNKGKQHTLIFDHTHSDFVNQLNEGILLLDLPKYPHFALHPILFHIKLKDEISSVNI